MSWLLLVGGCDDPASDAPPAAADGDGATGAEDADEGDDPGPAAADDGQPGEDGEAGDDGDAPGDCPPGTHPGSPEGACVPEDACEHGFGIPEGDDRCLPVDEVCADAPACFRPASWHQGRCAFEIEDDGAACDGGDVAPDSCVERFECRGGGCAGVRPACAEVRPIIFVHGINGRAQEGDPVVARLIEDGWPPDLLIRFQADDPSWTCNVDNAAAIGALIEEVRADTCHAQVDLVAHSMGGVSSRYFMKSLGGDDVVSTFVTLGTMHHGLDSPCLAPEFLGVCVWQELCSSGEFMRHLNEPPAVTEGAWWVSIFGTADRTIPNASSRLEGAENIAVEGVEHVGANGMFEREDVYAEVLRVLRYPCK